MRPADTLAREGGCRCGAHRYRVTGKPSWVAKCHCNDCRRSTGAPFTTWLGVRSDAFAWLTPRPAAHQSSPGTHRSFCSTCGTSLTFTSERWPGEVHVLLGTLDEPGSLAPRAHVFVESSLPWVHTKDGLIRFARTPKDGPPLA
jgi:hypothetical protein